jgi:hypothetical protein
MDLGVKSKDVKFTLNKAWHEENCVKAQSDELANPSRANPVARN